METISRAADPARPSELPLVDPRSPRFGQAITAGGLLAGIVLDAPLLVFAVAVSLVVAVLSRWRYDPYSIVWQQLLPVVGEPGRPPEPAAPHRFAKLIGAVGTTVASALLVAGVPVAGYAVAAIVAGAAGLGATTGICIGCRLYRGVQLFQRLDVV